MSKSVKLEVYELSPNVRKFCFALLMTLVVVTGASMFGLNVSKKSNIHIAAFLKPFKLNFSVI